MQRSHRRTDRRLVRLVHFFRPLLSSDRDHDDLNAQSIFGTCDDKSQRLSESKRQVEERRLQFEEFLGAGALSPLSA